MTTTPGTTPTAARSSTPRPSKTVGESESPSSPSRTDAPLNPRRNGRPAALADPLSDRATAALIRRTLCPQQAGEKGLDVPRPIEELLPPLTSRNDVDLQLYAFLAIVLREFVQAWYSKITSDEAFVAEILQIVAHCSRSLEQRFRKVDLESLLLDEIPDLLEQHVMAYRVAHQAVSTPPVVADPRLVYHSLRPMPAMAPVPLEEEQDSVTRQSHNEATYRELLIQAVLVILLPTEDLENPCLTALVGQILSDLIVGNVVANRAAQPWVIYEGICILSRHSEQKKQQQGTAKPTTVTEPVSSSLSWVFHSLLVTTVATATLIMSSIRLVFTIFTTASSLPPRPSFAESRAGSPTSKTGFDEEPVSSAQLHNQVPVLAYRLWPCLANLIGLQSRMPWLCGFTSLLQYGAISGPGRLGRLDGPMDRLLSHHIRSALSPSHLPTLLRTLRGVLFPNNAPGQSTLKPPSSAQELLALRRRAARAIWGLLPRGVTRLYFGGHLRSPDTDGGAQQDEEVDQVEALLMVLDDEYCNKHLVYGVLELIIVRLMPELSEKDVAELWEERLGS